MSNEAKSMIDRIEIKVFDYKNGTEQEYAAFTDCRNQIRAEQLPDDPPIPLKETKIRLQNIPAMFKMHLWSAKHPDNDSWLGYAELVLPMEHNLHLAQFSINVLTPFRQQGLGQRLLREVLSEIKAAERQTLIAVTMDRIPAGEAFLTSMGATKGLEGHTNQLALADLDRHLIQQWQDEAQKRAADFEIGLWDGPYPEQYIDDMVALSDLFNQVPTGEIDVEYHFTADILRQQEQSLVARGYERWTIYVREKSSQKFAGYTEVMWNPNRPDVVEQGITGVFAEYRNKGLGRWLKARMLAEILEKRPQAKFVRTENADSNAPMLKINEELGFKPYYAETIWQIPLEKVSAYVSHS